MNKQKGLLVGALCAVILLGGTVSPLGEGSGMAASATQNQNQNQNQTQTARLIEEILAKKRVPVYAECTSTVYQFNFNRYDITKLKYWDNTANGLYRDEASTMPDGPVHQVVSKDGKTTIYKVGDPRAIVYPAPTTFAASIDPVYNLNKLKATTDITLAGEEQISNRPTYHFVGKGKAVPIPPNMPVLEASKNRKYPDLELWIDKETGIVMKSKGDHFETLVTKLDVAPPFAPDTFTLTLPQGVKTVTQEDLMKEEQAKQTP